MFNKKWAKTLDFPGFCRVKAKAGLNRAILDTAPAAFVSMIEYKAAEAGARVVETPTRDIKPTQRCHRCWAIVPKPLAERVHCCQACSCVCGRDENAAKTNLLWAIAHTGWEPARRGGSSSLPLRRETPALANL